MIIPQIENKNSIVSPSKNTQEGVPSKMILSILPIASPPMNKIFDKVAATQNLGLTIPINQNIAIPIYKPINALKTMGKSVFSNLNWKMFFRNPFGIKPYTTPTRVIVKIDMIKCRFFVFKNY